MILRRLPKEEIRGPSIAFFAKHFDDTHMRRTARTTATQQQADLWSNRVFRLRRADRRCHDKKKHYEVATKPGDTHISRRIADETATVQH